MAPLLSPSVGDYYQALRVIENIELDKKGLYSRVPACRITIFYYVGFCYLMMGRYEDSVRTFSTILYYITRTQQSQAKAVTGGFNVIKKKGDQIYNLLAIAHTLCPSRLDETVQGVLLDKCGDKMQRMQKGEIKVFRDMFHYGSPKFLAPTAPDYDALTEEEANAAYRLQLKIFEADVSETLKLPVIRSYLKLYSTMPVKKLAAFLELVSPPPPPCPEPRARSRRDGCTGVWCADEDHWHLAVSLGGAPA